MFRKSADITSPTGTGAGRSAILGLQERNQRNLLEIFSAAAPIMEEIAKVKPETWRTMKGLFTSLEGNFGTGVKAIGQGFLRPARMIQNRFMNMAEGFMAPLMVGLNNISNQIESFALQNQQGATVGAIAGGIIGLFVGHPGLGALFGSMLGTLYQGLPGQYATEEPYKGEGRIGGPWDPYAEGVYIGVSDPFGGTTQTSATGGALPPPPNVVVRPFPGRTGFGRKLIDYE